MIQKNKRILELKNYTNDSILNLVLDTLERGKQIIIFVNSKRNAESLAKRISFYLKDFLSEEIKSYLKEIAEKIKNVLDIPTEQCTVLSECVQYGVAFHHSGLLSEQRAMIENEFKKGNIKVIVCTPTLSAGINLPAYRVLIKEIYRFDNTIKPISRMEFHQMAGRAGRPDYEKEGEAIVLSDNEDFVYNNYINKDPEEIISKISVETKLRSIILSLCCKYTSTKEIYNFMQNTFFAHQYGDFSMLKNKILSILRELHKMNFIRINKDHIQKEFIPSNEITDNFLFVPTELGRRVNDLYLDPYTAANIVKFFSRNDKNLVLYLYTLTQSYELLPLFSVSKKEEENLISFMLQNELPLEDTDSIQQAKFVMILLDWINEKSERLIEEEYNVRPGELKSKLEIIEWLGYASEEISKIVNPEFYSFLKIINLRLKYGVKDELVELCALKYIGRMRSRQLYEVGIKNVKDLLLKQSSARKVLGKFYDLVLKENNLYLSKQ
ncbi:MAG: helicase-related protein [Candidatus Woesearchaeota archaeon]